MNIAEAARYLGITKAALYQQRSRGTGPKERRPRWYDVEDLDDWLAGHEQSSPGRPCPHCGSVATDKAPSPGAARSLIDLSKKELGALEAACVKLRHGIREPAVKNGGS